MGIIVSTFVGCGKTSLMAEMQGKIRIRDCGPYNEDTDLEEYVSEAVELSNSNDIVFVSSSEDVRNKLDSMGVDFDLFYPTKERRIEMLEGQVSKRTPMAQIALYDRNFNAAVEALDSSELEHEHKHLLGEKGEFLSNNELITRYIGTVINEKK